MRDFIIKNGVLERYIGKEKVITIPEDITSIGNRAFYGCNAVREISISKSITNIGDKAFSHCNNLNTVILGEGVKSIGWNAFDGCGNLSKIIIPEGVTYIGDQAFYGCNALVEITIPKSITHIGSKAFGHCNNLSEVTILNGLKSIGDVFYYCVNLKKVSLPESISRIRSNAFYRCDRLEEIILPKNLTTIGEKAFNCTNLKKIIINSVQSDITKDLTEAFSQEFPEIRSINIPINKFSDDSIKISAILGYAKGIQEGKNFSDDVIQKNNTYIMSERTNYFDLAINEKAVLNLMLDEKMISLEDIFILIDKITNNTNLTAMLLEYRQANFSMEDIEKFNNKLFEL